MTELEKFEEMTRDYFGILSGPMLVQAIRAGIVDAKEECVNGASIDVHLDSKFLLEDKGTELVRLTQGIRQGPKMREVDGFVVIKPKGFCLASTKERVNLPSNIVCFADTLKSTAGRFGLEHMNAGLCDPGFDGTITLEFVNALEHHSIGLKSGDAVTQLIFEKVADAGKYAYNRKAGSKYSGQNGVTQGRDVQNSQS